jgi:uncharacterized protein
VIVPDVNVLIHAMDSDSRHHEPAWQWWSHALTGVEHVGLSWSVLTAYVRLTTHPRILGAPMDVATATGDVQAWLASPITVVLQPGPEHMQLMTNFLVVAGGGGDLVPDAHLAALAFENGGTVYSQDADFARFTGVRWINPLVA